jgi:hypothetical protein
MSAFDPKRTSRESGTYLGIRPSCHPTSIVATTLFLVVGDPFKHGKFRAVAVRLIGDEENAAESR